VDLKWLKKVFLDNEKLQSEDYLYNMGTNCNLQRRLDMLRLVKLEKKYMPQLLDMMDEWYATGEKIIPYAIRKVDYHDYTIYVDNLEVKENRTNLVPDSTFFCLDEERNIFVGAINIRHFLNDNLLKNGGHIGDGVRPSERRKGIATKMIGLALEECKKLEINKVLMVCDKNNIASAKSIINNRGILENEIEVDGIIEQRYWINNI
jgi:predicted acetyltransferase